MAQHMATAFKWTGTYYNATYSKSYKVTFEDDDKSYEGSGDRDEKVSVESGASGVTWGQPHAIKVNFTDTDGNEHVETFYFFNVEGDWYFVPGPGSAFTEGATLGTYQSHTDGWEYSDIVCFAAGTLIETAAGPARVEQLRPGDRITVMDGRARPLRLNLRRELSGFDLKAQPRLRPVRIVAGALGPGLPEHDLRVSRQHRMLVASPICERMFGSREVLIPAIRLAEWPGCFVEEDCAALAYHHLVFDRHEVVFANGVPSESFFPGPEAMKTIPEAARREVLELFPELHAGPGCTPARPIPEGRQQKRLVSRHLKNGKPLIAAAEAAPSSRTRTHNA